MTSQISDIYIRKPAASRLGVLPVAGLIGGVLAIGTAAAWLWNGARERPLADRTRDRLAPRPARALAPAVVGVPAADRKPVVAAVPNASDIHVG